VICAVAEIEKSTLFGGGRGEMCPRRSKTNFIAKFLNIFIAHCSLICHHRPQGFSREKTPRKKKKNLKIKKTIIKKKKKTVILINCKKGLY